MLLYIAPQAFVLCRVTIHQEEKRTHFMNDNLTLCEWRTVFNELIDKMQQNTLI